MAFWNLRKKSTWHSPVATLAQGLMYGSSAGASADPVQIDTGLSNVKAFIPIRDTTATTDVLFNCRVSATDNGVVQVREVAYTGASVAPATFRWIAFGDL